MNFPKDDNELDKALAETFGSPSEADFEAWRQQHSGVVACLNPQRIRIQQKRSRMMNRILVFATTAIVLICVCLGFTIFDKNGQGTSAFAQIVEQIQKAKTIAWKETIYHYTPIKNKKMAWLKTEEEWAYKEPGLYQQVEFDEKNQVYRVTILDAVNNKQLRLYPKSKKALLEELAMPCNDRKGPFNCALSEIKAGRLQWVAKRKTAAGEVNVFRSADDSGGRHWSFDLWIDQGSKKIVREQIPGTDIYDPDNDPQHNNPIGEKWPNGSPICCVRHDIVFNPKLDDSLFKLDPPEGYTIQVQHRNYVTEKEMIEWLSILAELNNKTFPGQFHDQLSLDMPIADYCNEIAKKPEKERTASERHFFEAVNHYMQADLGGMPLYYFITDNVVAKSFRYFGKGVKLGDKDGIVCWYMLKGAKTYRVVYGDLSVKDVDPKDLPLPVEP